MTDFTIGERMSMTDFLALPESSRILELIHGELVMTPPPTDLHQQTVGAFYSYIKSIMPGGTIRIAPTGVYLDDQNFVEPDIFWARADSDDCALTPDGRYWRGAPDLIVEVRSPSTGLHDKREKYALYSAHGVKEYWIVAPEFPYVEVFHLEDGKYVYKGTFGVDDTFTAIAIPTSVDVAAAFNS
jgi:Uma2 family endonuclease